MWEVNYVFAGYKYIKKESNMKHKKMKSSTKENAKLEETIV